MVFHMFISLRAHNSAGMAELDNQQVARRARDMDGLNHNSAWIDELDELQFRPKGEGHGCPESQFGRTAELDAPEDAPAGRTTGM